MSETLQVAIVTLVATGALAALVRPLFGRRKQPAKPGGCATCGSAPAGRRPDAQKQA